MSRYVVALLVLVAAISSCTSIVGVDGYKDATQDLCALLQRCYVGDAQKDCATRVARALEQGGAADEKFLADYANNRCADSCSLARACLDHDPLCVPSPSGANACTVREDCCGFTSGENVCDGGRCCSRRGAPCRVAADCCENPEDGCTPDMDGELTCGGVKCLAKDAACTFNTECCTGSCRGNHCDELCNEEGFDCASANDCCLGLDCVNARCGIKPCKAEATLCNDTGDCCGGLTCVRINPTAKTGVCSSGESCLPTDIDCARDSDCCSKHCDTSFFVCAPMCQATGQPCQGPEDCCSANCAAGVCGLPGCSTTFCNVPTDCCSGNCDHGACGPVCSPAPECPVAPHDPCTEGSVLNTACGDPCVAAVCQLDPSCCCTAWDSVCVSEALLLKPTACMMSCL